MQIDGKQFMDFNEEALQALRQELMNDKASVAEMADEDDDDRAERVLLRALYVLRRCKPNDRSEKDRRYAVTITEMEKVYAYFDTWVLTGGEHQE